MMQPAQVLRAPSYSKGDYPAALREAFLSLDAMMRDPHHQAELWAVRHDVPIPEPDHPKKTAREAGQLAEAPAGPGQWSARCCGCSGNHMEFTIVKDMLCWKSVE